MSTDSNVNKAKYIYEMGYLVRMDLCKILNQNGKWEELAGKYMFKPNLKIVSVMLKLVIFLLIVEKYK